MNSSITGARRSRRSRLCFRYTMRGLLGLALVISVVMMLVGRRMQTAATQRAAREKLLQKHWSVLFDFQHDVHFNLCPYTSPGPDWVRKLCGTDFLADVTVARSPNLDHPAPKVEDFRQLQSFPRLGRLDLQCHATDEALRQLSHFKDLKQLNIGDGTFAPFALSHLRQMDRLTHLYAARTAISDDALMYLKGLRKLEVLDLSNTQISGLGLRHLENLTALKWIELNNTGMSDSAMGHVARMRRLTDLYLSNTAITDAGLLQLTDLQSLVILCVDGTKITAHGVDRLRTSLPHVTVFWDDESGRTKGSGSEEEVAN